MIGIIQLYTAGLDSINLEQIMLMKLEFNWASSYSHLQNVVSCFLHSIKQKGTLNVSQPHIYFGTNGNLI